MTLSGTKTTRANILEIFLVVSKNEGLPAPGAPYPRLEGVG